MLVAEIRCGARIQDKEALFMVATWVVFGDGVEASLTEAPRQMAFVTEYGNRF